jgi:hypothetical protein
MTRKRSWFHGIDDAELAKQLAAGKEKSDAPPHRPGGFISMRPPCHENEDCPDKPPDDGQPPRCSGSDEKLPTPAEFFI